MSLQTRLGVFLAVSLLVLLLSNGILTYRTSRKEMERSHLEHAEQIRSVLMSTRKVYHQQFLESGIELTPKTIGFLPAHALTQISAGVESFNNSGFSFNNISDISRNPSQAADSLELEVMAYFRENPLKEIYFKEHEESTGAKFFQYAWPIRIEQYCLKCHGDKDEAPAIIRELYDTAFDYKVGDLRGLMSIRISSHEAEQNLAHYMKFLVFSSFSIFLLAFIGISFLFHRFLNRPVSQIIKHVSEVAHGTEGKRLPSLPGELSLLTEAVNHMAQKIENDRAELVANEQTYRSLVEGIFAAPWSIDVQTRRFTYIGPQLEPMVGYKESEFPDYDSWMAKVHPDDQELVSETLGTAFEEGGDHQVEYRLIAEDGRDVWVKEIATVVKRQDKKSIVGFIVDITNQKMAEEQRNSLERQVQQAQKMESLGILAGGVAHDFNNILTGILGHAELVLTSLGPESEIKVDIEAIVSASLQAADLSKQMLAYSGKGKFKICPIHMGNLVHEMTSLLEVTLSKKETMKVECPQHLSMIEGDPTQISQVLMNLITNASESITDSNGLITIKLGELNCDSDYFATFDQATGDDGRDLISEGKYVFIEVSDNGAGMDEKTREKIFDPFFTTKFTGRGLGLAAVLGIMRGHNGAIKVYSELGTGTTFKILFPVIEQQEIPCSPEILPKNPAWTGSGTILFVDDESIVRALGCRMLEKLGFGVISAEDGLEALEIFHQREGQFTCVIVDLTMPRMGGEQLFHELRRIKPDTRIIISSGYNEQEVSQHFAGKGLCNFIQKPYQLSSLRRILRQTITER